MPANGGLKHNPPGAFHCNCLWRVTFKRKSISQPSDQTIFCACDPSCPAIDNLNDTSLFDLANRSLPMSTLSALVSASTSVITSLTTSFSTIYRTSQPVVLITVTSIVSQFNTFLQTVTLTQSEVIMASTIAVPITATQTKSQLFTSTPTYSLPPPPPASIEIVTSTLISTLIQPGQTITYYPPPPPIVLQTATTQVTLYPSTSTVTFTEVDFVLANAAGSAYTTITTTLPLSPTPTDGAVFLINTGKYGWDSWSDAAKGGLIAGVVIAGLLILGLIIWCLMRRRNIWLASDWVGPPSQQVVPTQPMNQVHWGPGPAGWGVRG